MRSMRWLSRHPKLAVFWRSVLDATIGALLMLALLSWQRMRDDDALFRQLVQVADLKAAKVAGGVPSEEARALAILHAVYAEVRERAVFFGDTEWTTPHLLWSAGDHMNRPAGACASYVTVLAKAMQTAGYPVRKVGLVKNGIMAYHHVLEAKIDGRWAVLDAAFDQSFRRPDGKLASAADVHEDWLYYRTQMMPGYYPEYDYSGYYYTNWSRIPGAEMLFGWFPEARTWLHDHGVSVRFWFLSVHAWLIGFGLAGAGLLVLVRGCSTRKKVGAEKPSNTVPEPREKPKMPEWVRQQVLEVPLPAALPAAKRG
jgi:hypothetical protein